MFRLENPVPDPCPSGTRRVRLRSALRASLREPPHPRSELKLQKGSYTTAGGGNGAAGFLPFALLELPSSRGVLGVPTHPVCQEEPYNPGRDVSINPNKNSILTP